MGRSVQGPGGEPVDDADDGEAQVAVVPLAGELDATNGGALLGALAEIQESGERHVVLDLGGVTRCPGAAARLIVRAQTGLRERGVRLEILAPGGAVRHVLSIAGLTDLSPAAFSRRPATRTCEPAPRREEGRAETLRLLRRMADLPRDTPERLRLRDGVVEGHMGYARHLSRRYARVNEGNAEDLNQVAYLGLIKAVEQFDPEHGTEFLGYATPMILGEIRRHFRDGTWAVHVPRRMQELSGAVYRAKDELRSELGREPLLPELAAWLGTDVEQVVAAIDAGNAYRASSLDHSVGDGEGAATLGHLIGVEDPGLDSAMHREVLRSLVAELSGRDKRVLLLRYFRSLSQAEIGRELGTSQMQVSRILAKIIERLRSGFFPGP